MFVRMFMNGGGGEFVREHTRQRMIPVVLLLTLITANLNNIVSTLCRVCIQASFIPLSYTTPTVHRVHTAKDYLERFVHTRLDAIILVPILSLD